MYPIFDYFIKIVFLGNNSTGKSSLILRFLYDKFYDRPTNTDFYFKIMEINNKIIKAQICEEYAPRHFSIRECDYKKTHGAIIIYDITDINSFENAKYWIELIKKISKVKTEYILVGNKCDDEPKRKVKVEEGKNLADEYGIKFFECSAKDNINVDEIFYLLLNDIVENFEKEKYSNIKLNKNKENMIKSNKCAQ